MVIDMADVEKDCGVESASKDVGEADKADVKEGQSWICDKRIVMAVKGVPLDELRGISGLKKMDYSVSELDAEAMIGKLKPDAKSARFSVEYLDALVRILKKRGIENALLTVAKDMPILAEADTDEQHIKIIIAPRIESD